MQNQYIPQIDIAPVFKYGLEAPQSKLVIRKIHEACRDVGFMSIINHGISPEFIQNMLSKIKQFHYLPESEKIKFASKKWNPANTNKYRGYFPSNVNGKEGFDITDPLFKQDQFKKNYFYEQNYLPQNLSNNWQSIIKQYYSKLHELGITLIKIVLHAFNKIESWDLLEKGLSRPNCLSTLRFNYYPKHHSLNQAIQISAQDGQMLACQTHYDSSIFTILFQDSEGGLQVKNSKDKKWCNVPFNKEAYVINTGKALEILTNGHYKATLHRVLFNIHQRISIPFFFEPNMQLNLDSKYLVEEDYNYKVQTYGEFLTGSLKKFKEYQRQQDQSK